MLAFHNLAVLLIVGCGETCNEAVALTDIYGIGIPIHENMLRTRGVEVGFLRFGRYEIKGVGVGFIAFGIAEVSLREVIILVVPPAVAFGLSIFRTALVPEVEHDLIG